VLTDYITDAKGRKLTSGEIPTTAGAFRQRLRPYLQGGLRVALEAGNQSAWLHDLLVDLGAEVTVVNPAKLKLIAESRRKTDKIDARVLCELLRLDGLPEPVHVPNRETRSLRGSSGRPASVSGGADEAVQRRPWDAPAGRHPPRQRPPRTSGIGSSLIDA